MWRPFQLVKVFHNGRNLERYANWKVLLTDSKRLEPIARSLLSSIPPSFLSSSSGWATNFYAGSLPRVIVPLARPLDCFRSLNVERLRSLVNSLVIANFSRRIYGNCASFCAIYARKKKRRGQRKSWAKC